jgi:uncharacterized protein YbjQ (UPF0145 family)
MIVTTMDGVAGRITQETMGVVRGTQLWSKRVIKSSFGGIRNFQVTGMQDLDAGLAEAKDKAQRTMIGQAKAMGADSVIGVRIDVVELSNGTFCVNATGTAVKTISLPVSVPSFEAAPPAEAGMEFDLGFLAARPAFHGSILRH